MQAGETVLVHAAAGGVGTLLVQWAKALGAAVIGTVGSEEKAALARRLGCDHVILYRDEDVAARVREITGGAGVPVAYDSVGKDTFEATLKSLARRGLFVSFGNASGAVPAFEPLRLSRAGSLFLTRPTLFDYIATTAELDESAGALFAMIGSGKLQDRDRPDASRSPTPARPTRRWRAARHHRRQRAAALTLTLSGG